MGCAATKQSSKGAGKGKGPPQPEKPISDGLM